MWSVVCSKNLPKSCDRVTRQVYINPALSPYAAKLAYEKQKKSRELNGTLEESTVILTVSHPVSLTIQ